MANDLFGGLSGLMKGLSGFMPKDDPQAKLFQIQSEISDLEKQQNDIYAQIGKQAYDANPAAWPQADTLRLIKANLDAALLKRDEMERDAKAEDTRKKAAEAALVCPNCDHQNMEGVKFCQECGARLRMNAGLCSQCAAPLPPGTRFCGECGAKQEG